MILHVLSAAISLFGASMPSDWTDACSGVGQGGDHPAVVYQPHGGGQIAGKLSLIQVPLTADMRDAVKQLLQHGAKGTLRLTIEGVHSPRTDIGVRVYAGSWNDAEQLSPKSVQHVGTFSFFSQKKDEEGSYSLDLGPALRRQGADAFKQELRLGLIAISTKSQQPLTGDAVTYKRIRITWLPQNE